VSILPYGLVHNEIFINFQEAAVELVIREILKRQATKPSSTTFAAITTTTTPVNINALDSQSTTSKGLLSHCFDIPQNHLTSASTPYDELNEKGNVYNFSSNKN
jgi:hypothetical protein